MNYEKQNVKFLAAVESQLIVKRMRKQDLAGIIGMSKSSLYDKLSHPEKFSIGEVRTLCDALKIPAESRALLV